MGKQPHLHLSPAERPQVPVVLGGGAVRVLGGQVLEGGLAGDDLSAAQKGAQHYLTAMKSAPHEGSAHAETMKLTAPAKAITEAGNIDQARMSFLVLSSEMSALVRHIGTEADTPLYIVHCPMAFENKGGSWIQNDKEVANPYYGSMMFRCGAVQTHIAGKENTPEK